MKEETIQTLHPQANKTNKKISLSKYNFIKANILTVLSNKEFTHTELMEELFIRVKDHFEGGVQWYGETVKLDLEARKIIERTKSKPEKYKLAKSNSMLNRTFKPFPILTTERLTLRQLIMNDEEEIFALRSDSEINKYLYRKIAETIDDARNFINTVNQNIDKNDALYWAITFSEKNILVGTICLFSFSDENEKCEIGYELLRNFQGKGIMKEAVEKVIDYAFNIIKVQKIEAFFHRNNQGSTKLLEKFSFQDSNEPGETDPDLICFHLTNLIDHLT